VAVSTALWFVGFGLMMASFSFLLGRGEEPQRPRITIETYPRKRAASQPAKVEQRPRQAPPAADGAPKISVTLCEDGHLQ
jgi:hypothetical protein